LLGNTCKKKFYDRCTGSSGSLPQPQPPPSVYGSTNKAYEPDPEQVSTISAPLGVYVDPTASRRMGSLVAEDSLSTGRPGSDPTADKRSVGNSTFYEIQTDFRCDINNEYLSHESLIDTLVYNAICHGN
jgi:hypothetical protein